MAIKLKLWFYIFSLGITLHSTLSHAIETKNSNFFVSTGITVLPLLNISLEGGISTPSADYLVNAQVAGFLDRSLLNKKGRYFQSISFLGFGARKHFDFVYFTGLLGPARRSYDYQNKDDDIFGLNREEKDEYSLSSYVSIGTSWNLHRQLKLEIDWIGCFIPIWVKDPDLDTKNIGRSSPSYASLPIYAKGTIRWGF